jgi:hypothetical protein
VGCGQSAGKADQTRSESSETIRRALRSRRDEIVRAAWRHAEVVRNALLHQRGRFACWCNDQNGPKVESAALVKSGYMLEYPCIPRYSFDAQTPYGVCESDSDNPTDADNQQERLIGWITGFVDGEGCFSIHFVRQPRRANRRGYRTGFQVGHAFAVTQGAKSIECLQSRREHI